MKINHVLASIVACTALLAGCATTPEGDRAERVIVQGATVLLIERATQPAVKAAAVVEAVDLVQTLLLDTDTTVGDLRSALLKRVAERELSPGEKMIALEAIATISDAVEQRVGRGLLDAQAIVGVNQVLSWVENTAALYVQN